MSVLNKKNEFLDFALKLSDESEKIIFQYFRTKLIIDNKEDKSPVTIADRNTELKIRELIKLQYPDHGILGEEYEVTNLDSEYLWVIDPIDGTKSFIAGHKDFGTLIALLHNKKPILGIINCPAHKERWIGLTGKKTTLNGKEVKTSNVEKVDESYTCTTGLYFQNQHFKKGFERITEETKYFRFGGDCYMYGMVASGLIDIVIEDTLKIHDYMALIPIIEGAGGKITDKYGKSIDFNSDGSVVATANEKLHKKVINLFK